MNISGLSASSYGLWDWCEWKYYLQQILKFEDESGPAALLGTMTHKVLEILSTASIIGHDSKSKVWDVDYLWNISFNHYYKRYPHIAADIKNDKLRKVCNGINELLDSNYSPIRINTISSEVSFTLPIESPEFSIERKENGEIKYLNIRGKIDRVDKLSEDTIEIIDYKTGSRIDWNSNSKEKKDELTLRKDIQPRMYHLAAKHLYPWATNVLVTFIYLVDGGPISMPFSDEDIKGTKDMLRRRFAAIRASEDPQMNKGWKCKMCSFKKNGDICENVWAEAKESGKEFIENKYTILNIRKYR